MSGMSEQSARSTLRAVVTSSDPTDVLAALQGDDDALGTFTGSQQRSIKRVRTNYDGDFGDLIESITDGDTDFGSLQTDRRQSSASQSTLGDSPERSDADRADERQRRDRARREVRDARKHRDDDQMDLQTAGSTRRLNQWGDEGDDDDENGEDGGSGN